MLASALIVLSLTVTVLAVLDFLLSEAQKKVVADGAIATWNVLDEAKKLSFTDWLKKPRTNRWLAITFGFSCALYGGAVLEFGSPYMGWILILFTSVTTFLLFALITLPIFSQLLKLDTRVWYMLIAVGVVYVPCSFLVSPGWPEWPPPLGYSAIMLVMLFMFLVLFASLMISIARILAYVASGVLFAGELIVRRIAEYPKGPIIAISAIFGGLVSLIKIFSG
jgi:hypothetical protein